ncbi:MAG: carboxypeptidase-like regulatory domain-containing protein, partial [Bacteroidales bacterium]
MKQMILSKLVLIALSVCLLSSEAYAQSVAKGKVVEAATGEPLTGVAIFVEGTSKGALSDSNGEFEVQVGKGASLRFSFI